MAETLGDAVLHLRTDDSGLDAGIDAAKGKAEGVAAKFQDVGSRVTDAGKKLSLAVTLPLVAFGMSAGNAASDAEELQSAFNTTFGELSSDMNSWAETTGNAMGRSTQEMQAAANMFGLFFNQAAPTKQAAADMSKEFAQLGQDLASFHNADPSETMENLRAGLAGEAEPLRKFGVFLNEAGVAAKAMEMGLASSSKELTDQDKILARYQLILEATKNAQGDVARTSGSTANQVRAGKAAYEELQVTLGNKLLPVITPLITGARALVNSFAQLPAPVQTGVLGFLAFAAALGPLGMLFGPLMTGIGAVVPHLARLGSLLPIIKVGFAMMRVAALAALPALAPFLVPLAAIAAAIGVVYLAWQNWDKIKPIIDAVGSAISTWWTANVQPILNAVGNSVKEVVAIFKEHFGNQIKNVVAMVTALMNGDFRGAWEAMKNIVATAISSALKIFETFAPNVARTLKALASNLVTIGREIIQGLVSGISANASAVWNALKSVVMSGINNIREFLGIRSPSLLFKEMGKDITDGLALGIEGGIPTVKGAMDSLGTAIDDAGHWTVDVGTGAMGTPADGQQPQNEPGQPTQENGDQWREGFRSWFKDGVRAAMDGDLGGFLSGSLQKVADGMFDRALDTLSDVLSNVLDGLLSSLLGGGGGGGGGLGSILGSLFAGGFSTGGMIPQGQWGVVGEKGPEPVYSSPKGVMVRPNRALSGMQMQAPTSSINMPINIDATGADPAALERVRSSIDRLAASVPSMAVGAVQDAGERGFMSNGTWR